MAAAPRLPRNSPRTLDTYSASVRVLDAFLAAQDMPRDIDAVQREHVEAFITHLLGARAATAHNRYRALRELLRLAR